MNLPRLKSEKGLTLIELVVAIAIMGIVMIAISSFLDFGNNMFRIGSDVSESQSEARLGLARVTDQIQYASAVQLKNAIDYDINYQYVAINGTVIELSKYDTVTSTWKTSVLASNINAGTTYFAPAASSPNDTLDLIMNFSQGSQTFDVSSKIKFINFALQTPVSTIVNGGNKVIAFKVTDGTTTPPPAVPVTSITNVTGTGNKNYINVSGEKLQMICTVLPINASFKGVTWTANAPSVATINAMTGELTPVGNGSVTVTATAGDGSGKTGSGVITISNQVASVLVTNITVTSSSGSIATSGGQLQMQASVLPANATNQSVIWSVSDTSRATIDSTGKLIAIDNGTVTVTATAADGSGITGTKAITLSGQVLLSITNIVANGTVPKGTTYNYTPTATGGLGPTYTYTFNVTAGYEGTVTTTGTKLTWNSPNGNGKDLYFTVTVKDGNNRTAGPYSIHIETN